MPRLTPHQVALQIIMEGFAGGDLPHVKEFVRNTREIEVEPYTRLFEVGEFHPHISMLFQGLVKVCVPKKDGSLATIAIHEENHVIDSVAGFVLGSLDMIGDRGFDPRPHEFLSARRGLMTTVAITLEPSTLLVGNVDMIRELAAKHSRWASMLINYLSARSLHLEYRLLELATHTPEELYRELLVLRPGLVRRVKQKELAAYIGVTPASLSRIAARINGERDEQAMQ